MFHTLAHVGLLVLMTGSQLAPPSLPPPPTVPVTRSVDAPRPPEARMVEGSGPWSKLFCVGCLAALLSGGTSVAAVVVTALVNPHLTLACTGICATAF